MTLKSQFSIVNTTSLLLAAIGAINWGLIGTCDYNLVEAILHNLPTVKNVVYSLVGVGGLVLLWNFISSCISDL